jgi:hypothetical protein
MKSLMALAIYMVLAVWSPGYGRIGETLEECIARYGEIYSESEFEGRKQYIFKKSGYVISICFYEKKADLMFLFKEEKDDLEFNAKFSDNEIEILHKSNAGDTPWEPIEIISLNKQWINKEKGLVSLYMYPANTLSFMTLGFMSRQTEKTKADEEKSLDGF